MHPRGRLSSVCFSPEVGIRVAQNGVGVMLQSGMIDHKIVLSSAVKVAERVLDRFPVKHGGLGCISAQESDCICDIWSSAEGSIETRSTGLLVHSSFKRLLISLDSIGLVAHFQSG